MKAEPAIMLFFGFIRPMADDLHLLLDPEIQKGFIVDISTEAVANFHRTHASRRACKDQVAHLQGKKSRYISNQVLKRKDQVAGIAGLHDLSVQIQAEGKVAEVLKMVFAYKLTQWCGPFKTLCDFPGPAILFALAL